MAEKKVVDWFTMNGKHIPIYDDESKSDAVNRAVAKANEDKKESDIKRNQEEADKLNGKKAKLDQQKKNTEQKYKAGLVDKDGYSIDSHLKDFADSGISKINYDTGEGHYEHHVPKGKSVDEFEKYFKSVAKKYPGYDVTVNTSENSDGEKFVYADVKLKSGDMKKSTSSVPNSTDEQKAAVKKINSFGWVGNISNKRQLETHPQLEEARKLQKALDDAPDGTTIVYDISSYYSTKKEPKKYYELYTKSGTGWKKSIISKNMNSNSISSSHNIDNLRGIRPIQKFSDYGYRFKFDHSYEEIPEDMRADFESTMKKKK